MTGRHFVSGQGNGLGGCRDGCSGAVLRVAALLVATAVLLVVLIVAACSSAPAPTNQPDPNTVSPCAEVDNPPPGCE